MKNEEFVADFILVSKRTLSADEYTIFKYHFLLGADWSLCCRKLKLERGEFFHEIYRIQQKLGRTFRELEPYGLFPIDEYFNGPRRGADDLKPILFPVETELPVEHKKVLKFPVRKAA